jgi:hypothetical protein
VKIERFMETIDITKWNGTLFVGKGRRTAAFYFWKLQKLIPKKLDLAEMDSHEEKSNITKTAIITISVDKNVRTEHSFLYNT